MSTISLTYTLTDLPDGKVDFSTKWEPRLSPGLLDGSIEPTLAQLGAARINGLVHHMFQADMKASAIDVEATPVAAPEVTPEPATIVELSEGTLPQVTTPTL